jgi:hypothetical protein
VIILWTLAEAERVAKVRSALDRDTLVCVWYCGSGYCCGHTEEGGSTWTKITAYLAGEWTFRNRTFYGGVNGEKPLGGGAVATLQREAEKMAGHGGGT